MGELAFTAEKEAQPVDMQLPTGCPGTAEVETSAAGEGLPPAIGRAFLDARTRDLDGPQGQRIAVRKCNRGPLRVQPAVLLDRRPLGQLPELGIDRELRDRHRRDRPKVVRIEHCGSDPVISNSSSIFR
jgi:hypothetical protein